MKFNFNDPYLKDRRRELRSNQTDAERKLWSLIRSRQIAGLRFLRQYGAGPYILDFYCPEKKLCVELDGGQHNASEHREYDKQRTEYLSSLGIKVIRFWDNEVFDNTQGVVEGIFSAVTPSSSPLS